jgi:hypothetical protein
MLPETDAAPEVHRTGHRLADLIVGFSAIFISVCSLALALQHGHTMERLVEANSRPFLEFGTSNGEARGGGAPGADPAGAGDVIWVMSVTIANPGAGAARIDRFSIALDGHAAADWSELFHRLKDEAVAKHAVPPGPQSSGPLTYSSVADSYLKAGAEKSILRWSRSEANAALWDYVDAARRGSRITLEACYCSIFDQCWIAQTKSFRPIPVKACS